jgi:uronate dehydrogenase
VAGGRVLITGASGLLGGVLLHGLRGHPLRGLDVQPSSQNDVVVDMRRIDDAVAAFAGIDTVIDLAATSSANASWQDVLQNNLPATRNALEAARLTQVRRVILASSNHVCGLVERDEPYASVLAGRYADLDPSSLTTVKAGDPVRPDGPYGVGKALGEAAARFYAEEYGISVLCLRIGSVTGDDRPTGPRHFSTFLSHRDLVSLVSCGLAAPDTLRFGIYFGVSANRWRIWDLASARRDLGYEPVDDAENWR